REGAKSNLNLTNTKLRLMTKLHVVKARSGDVITNTLLKGVAIIVEIIMLVIAGYFAALLVPGLLTAIATTALTSVSGAVITLFQTILPFTFVTVVIMLFLSVLIETFRSL